MKQTKMRFNLFKIILAFIGLMIILFNEYFIHQTILDFIAIGIGFNYLGLFFYDIIKLKKYKSNDNANYYPYQRLFIGPGKWFIFIIMISYSVLCLTVYDKSFLGIAFSIFWITILIERLLLNKMGYFNVEITEKELVINEEIKTELFFSNIENISFIDSDLIKIHPKNSNKKVFIYLNRIKSDFRELLKKQLKTYNNSLSK